MSSEIIKDKEQEKAVEDASKRLQASIKNYSKLFDENPGLLEYFAAAINSDEKPLYLTSEELTKEDIDVFYVQARNNYSEKRYEDALDCFAGMALLDYSDKRGWMGSGVCLEILQRYEKALGCYACAFQLDEKNPLPAFYSVDCHLKLNQTENALDALEKVISLSANKPEYAQQKKEAEELKSKLNSRS